MKKLRIVQTFSFQRIYMDFRTIWNVLQIFGVFCNIGVHHAKT